LSPSKAWSTRINFLNEIVDYPIGKLAISGGFDTLSPNVRILRSEPFRLNPSDPYKSWTVTYTNTNCPP
jgi:hypothetical protein